MAVRENNFWRLCGIEPWLQWWELGEISTMLPALIKMPIRQFIYCHHHSPGLQPHLSTRWTGQTRLTNSQGAIREGWIARCSPRAPGFSIEQYAKIGWTVILVTALATEPLTLKLKFIHISNQLILSCIYLMLNNGEGEGLKILEKKVD